jgi:hypothetical protein
MSLRRLVARAALIASMSVLLYGCTGGLSCGGDSGGCINAYPYPSSGLAAGTAPVDDGARMRMTQAGLDFLSTHIKELLIAVAGEDPNNPGVIMISSTDRIDLPYGAFGQGEDETHPTEVFIDANNFANSIEMEFVEGSTAQEGIYIRAEDVPVGLDARHFVDWGLGNAACDLFGTNSAYGGEPWITGVTIEMLIKPRVSNNPTECDVPGVECLKIDVEILELDVDPRGNFGAGAIELDKPQSPCSDDGLGNCSEECSDDAFPFDPCPDCECDGVCFVQDQIVDILAFILGVVENLLGGFLPPLVEGLVTSALDDFDGAPIAVADSMKLQELSDDLIPATAHALGYLFGPTGSAFDVNCPTGMNCEEQRGMDFILRSGMEPAPDLDDPDPLDIPHPCVEPLIGGDFASFYEQTSVEFFAPDAQPLTGETGGETYHLGVSLARAAANQMLYATYNAGIQCIELSSDDVHTLAGGAFPLSAGTLDLLTEGKLRQFAAPSAPAIVTVVPSEPPKIEFGAGTDTDGHINLTWDDVVIGFYVLVYERYARVFAVDVDISASLSIFVDSEDETLRLAIVDGPNIENFTERYNEMLPGVRFDDVLASLISLAFDSLLGDDLGFGYNIAGALEDALGVPIYVDFQGLETVPEDARREFINFYLSLTETPPTPLVPGVPQRFQLAAEPGLVRRWAEEGERPRAHATNEVRVRGADLALHPGVEVFAQTDFGPWRGPLVPDADGVLTVRDPKLGLVGQHTMSFRARPAGVHAALSPVSAPVRFWVDAQKPWAELEADGDALIASGTDIGTSPADLVFAWSVDGGTWSEYGDERERALDSLGEARRVSVRVRDLAGNESTPVTIDLGSHRVAEERRLDRVELPPVRADGGCSQTSSTSLGILGLFALLGLVRRVRRRP